LLIYTNLLWTEGREIAAFLILLLFISSCFYRKLLIVILPLFLFAVWFFRNPDRRAVEPIDESAILSPADGKVVSVDGQHVSIFLSPVDVHVNWCPITGLIHQVNYKKGKFLPAYKEESSRENESNEIEILHASGSMLRVKQVAGTVARRIVCWVKQDERVSRGQKFGMIKFGSRIDIVFPETATVAVKNGQRLRGGETVIGNMSWELQKDL
jgi:phosphatidylserine decarboxylase